MTGQCPADMGDPDNFVMRVVMEKSRQVPRHTWPKKAFQKLLSGFFPLRGGGTSQFPDPLAFESGSVLRRP